ncbi:MULTISPECIES: hypothetical protein [unclassified Streptomyces]|uniref:hypothetical protein n=1 Tax=unclassified Streptomyces TaxID=2593676 RepID=UPI000B1F2073|nr:MULTISPECIES: hypothetical protein [unclassified Streptomyces]
MSDGKPDESLTADQVAHPWAGDVFAEDPDPADRVRPAFGLLDLLDGYRVTRESRFADAGAEGPLPVDALWDGYRQRLEADEDAETVTYSLWADWFEDRTTSATAVAEVLGDDIDRVVADPSEALLRRARRVLECSGPVPWTAKEPTYRTALPGTLRFAPAPAPAPETRPRQTEEGHWGGGAADSKLASTMSCHIAVGLVPRSSFRRSTCAGRPRLPGAREDGRRAGRGLSQR